MRAMASHSHTYGPKCRLAPVARRQSHEDVPAIDSQFFYSSLIPIDEPLSAQLKTAGPDKSNKSQLRPFSLGDNNSLERAWLSLASEDCQNNHECIRLGKGQRSETLEALLLKRRDIVHELAAKHVERHQASWFVQQASSDAAPPPSEATGCCPELSREISDVLQQQFCSLVLKTKPMFALEQVVQDTVAAIRSSQTLTAKASEEDSMGANVMSKTESKYNNTPGPNFSYKRLSWAVHKKGHTNKLDLVDQNPPDDDPAKEGSASQITSNSNLGQRPNTSSGLSRSHGAEVGISGQPFVRVETVDDLTDPNPLHAATVSSPIESSVDNIAVAHRQDTNHSKPRKTRETKEVEEVRLLDVVVGVSRLHKVSLPTLQMKPIYWSPVNDVSVVTRGTWFYRDTMLPVAPTVANQLEAGYHELRPWTETWEDELKCAIEVGPLGEEKISHCLWPQDSRHWNPSGGKDPEPRFPIDAFCSARCSQGHAAAQGSPWLSQKPPASVPDRQNRPFANYHVIYRDRSQAFLLKPSLRPSAYYGRKPALKIVRGLTVGIPVIRGFDRLAWGRVYGDISTPGDIFTMQTHRTRESGNIDTGPCHACDDEQDKGQVTDLVLVAHGIGQKFAERVESFHFTHAINSFRRAVNLEMNSPVVQKIRRPGQNGVMILPLNWRMGLSFEDGGPAAEHNDTEQSADLFGLKDIEPNTIPAIRSMISDVMFDIPFYMSHHKGRMIKALVSEANRVYRLWCRNNQGFSERGRVHMIAHSLGSVMAIDILSKQPSNVPKLDLSRAEPETHIFEFDTTNLFLVGSPAGFFLLLERGMLQPRLGREKPGANATDIADRSVAADSGRFGCLAVDNIYNVLAKEDPIAYLLNGAIDPNYAAALQIAYVPSTSASLLKSLGDVVRQVVPGMSPVADPFAVDAIRPLTVRLPSQLELEVHDFTREEIAERRAFLLNDNGQVDWYLRSGSGPLEIQYLNMLSAHTSYWINQDFIRMVCIEVGREPGRSHSVPVMRAVKATKRFSAQK